MWKFSCLGLGLAVIACGPTGTANDASGHDVQADTPPLSADTRPADTAPQEAGPKAMIALHLDPNGPSQGVTNATPEHWQRLVEIVAKADEYGHKLTLLMAADWADLASGDPAASQALKTWITHGHQLGFHHHTCEHKMPDGYRDVPGDPCGMEADRGSVAIAFGKVRDLGASLGVGYGVNTAAQGLDTKGIYRAAEWQAEALYATGPQGDNGDGHSEHEFITQPRCTTSYGNSYGGQDVTYKVPEFGHAQLDVGGFVDSQKAHNLATLEAEIDVLRGEAHQDLGAHIGVVFHPREYADTPRQVQGDDFTTDKAYLDAIFQLFWDKDLSVVTAQELLSQADPCAE